MGLMDAWSGACKLALVNVTVCDCVCDRSGRGMSNQKGSRREWVGELEFDEEGGEEKGER